MGLLIRFNYNNVHFVNFVVPKGPVVKESYFYV
jgi:hypothetical protein